MWAEIFEQCWEKVTKETGSEQIDMEHGTEPAASADAPIEDATSPEKAKSAAKAKAKGKAAAAKPSAAEDASAKKLVASLQRGCQKTKIAFQNAVASAMQVLEQIEKDPVWSWAKGTAHHEGLQEATATLRGSVGEFGKAFLMGNDWAELRKKHTVERLTVELSTFLETRAMIVELELETKQICKAHEVLRR